MIGQDDARLTAYVVDEVDPETTAAIEEALQESASLRDEAGDIRAAAALLAQALRGEAAPMLRSAQRVAITEASRAQRRGAPVARRAALWVGLAASLVAMAVTIAHWRGSVRDAGGPRTTSAAGPPAPIVSSAPIVVVRPVVPHPPIASSLPTPPNAAPVPSADEASAPGTPAVVASAPDTIIQGVVTDTSGAPLPGTTITARSLDSGRSITATSNNNGEFRVEDRLAGRVELRAELAGFLPAQQEVLASPTRVVSWAPKLAVGAMTESVMVVADSLLVDAEGLAPGYGEESYAHRADNGFVDVASHPLSTFSLDVDTASYANVRRFLTSETLPPPDAVRIEEMVNYFPYDYAAPRRETFAAHLELAPAPWKPEHRLLRIGLKAREIAEQRRPASNLVFLVDVSGSMEAPNKLSLVKRALAMLVERLDGRDRVALAVYAGAAGLVLPPTSGADRTALLRAIDRLQAGGSTNGAQGIQLAYDTAAGAFLEGGNNRVILATDGDFNVGMTDEGSLTRLIEERAKGGVFLSVLGFGMGNYKDSTLEMLADKGNGNYAYVDTEKEARKTLVEQLMSTLFTVAKDVKIQVEFNPTRVRSYRLLGYENRLLRDQDFRDDSKDAGEVGAGHTVTALYEIVPAGEGSSRPVPEKLRYQKGRGLTGAARSDELMRLAVRYKEPRDSRSLLLQWPVRDEPVALANATSDFRFAAAVAEFGMLLQDSSHKGAATFDDALALAESAKGPDVGGYRQELVDLVGKARTLSQHVDSPFEP